MSDSWVPDVHEAHHADEPHRQAGAVLHVVTWNIQFGIATQAAAEALRTEPQLAAADVVLLQEMDETGTDAIAREAGMNSVFASSTVHPRTGRNFGNAVLSRWPLRDAEVVMLSHKSAVQGQYRIAVRATVSFGAVDVDACSVHTEVPSLSPPKRLRQFEEIAEATERWAPERLVVGGDFNTLTRRGVNAVSGRLHRVGAQRVSVGAGTTLRRGGREFTLDHVFARSMSAIDSGVVRGLAASDHRPLWVQLRV